jgi:hypothetical protein
MYFHAISPAMEQIGIFRESANIREKRQGPGTPVLLVPIPEIFMTILDD